VYVCVCVCVCVCLHVYVQTGLGQPLMLKGIHQTPSTKKLLTLY